MNPQSELAYEAGIEYAWSGDCDLSGGQHPVPKAFAQHAADFLLGVQVGIEQSWAFDSGAMAAEDEPRRGQDFAGAPFALGCEALAAIYESGWADGVTLGLIALTRRACRCQIGTVH